MMVFGCKQMLPELKEFTLSLLGKQFAERSRSDIGLIKQRTRLALDN